MATVGIGFGAHYFKKKHQALYGCVEILFSVAYALNSMISAHLDTNLGTIALAWTDQRLYWIGVFGSVYIFARGLNNLAEAKTKKNPCVNPLPTPSASPQPS
jgi:hypothetical protein